MTCKLQSQIVGAVDGVPADGTLGRRSMIVDTS